MAGKRPRVCSWPSVAAVACALAAAVAVVTFLPAASASGSAISGQRAVAFVRELAALGPRPAGSGAERRAGRLVEAELRRLGYQVATQPFRLPRGGVSRNVVGTSGGRPRAVLVAHLDGVRGTVAANDNGSGVAALLEAARALRARRGLWVAALGAEERFETGSPLHLGSARLMRGLSPALRRGIRVALSLDMVAVGPTLNVRGLEPSPNRSARLALARARAAGITATYRQDTGQSDHAELTRGGVPAAWIEWRWDECWHRPCDRPERLAAWKIARAARIAVASAHAVLGAR